MINRQSNQINFNRRSRYGTGFPGMARPLAQAKSRKSDPIGKTLRGINNVINSIFPK